MNIRRKKTGKREEDAKKSKKTAGDKKKEKRWGEKRKFTATHRGEEERVIIIEKMMMIKSNIAAFKQFISPSRLESISSLSRSPADPLVGFGASSIQNFNAHSLNLFFLSSALWPSNCDSPKVLVYADQIMKFLCVEILGNSRRNLDIRVELYVVCCG